MSEKIDRSEWTEYECKCGHSWREYGEDHDERGELQCAFCMRDVQPGETREASCFGGSERTSATDSDLEPNGGDNT